MPNLFRCISSGTDDIKMIEREYNPLLIYHTDDTAIYGNRLYVCLENGVTGEWDWSKWKAVYLTGIAKFKGSFGDVYNLGTGTSFDIKEILPDINHSLLTSDNFLVVNETSGSAQSGSNYASDTFAARANYTPPTKTYDSETGVLTITGNTLGAILGEIDSGVFTTKTTGGATLTPTVYLITNKITKL